MELFKVVLVLSCLIAATQCYPMEEVRELTVHEEIILKNLAEALVSA